MSVTEAPTQAAARASRRWVGFAFVLLVIAALIGMLVFGVLRKGSATNLSLAGKPAPEFTINLFDGGTFTLSQQQGKVVVINLWASWCGPCREEAPALTRVWNDVKDKGNVIFIGVDVQDTESDARAFMKEFGVTYPNGPDATNEVSVKYALTGLPETTFVNPRGIVTNKHIGAMTESQLRSYIAEALR